MQTVGVAYSYVSPLNGASFLILSVTEAFSPKRSDIEQFGIQSTSHTVLFFSVYFSVGIQVLVEPNFILKVQT
jgi:hypothetical protein